MRVVWVGGATIVVAVPAFKLLRCTVTVHYVISSVPLTVDGVYVMWVTVGGGKELGSWRYKRERWEGALYKTWTTGRQTVSTKR